MIGRFHMPESLFQIDYCSLLLLKFDKGRMPGDHIIENKNSINIFFEFNANINNESMYIVIIHLPTMLT